MKTFEIKPHNLPLQTVRAESIGEAQAKLGLVSSDVHHWRVVPTARQIRCTQNLLRNL